MNEDGKINIKAILKAIVFSVGMTILCLIIFAVICYFANVPEKIIGGVVFLVAIISIFVGSIFVSKNLSKSGFLHGGLIGGGYFLILMLASIVISHSFQFSQHLLSMAIGSIGAGMLGGILGINSGSKF